MKKIIACLLALVLALSLAACGTKVAATDTVTVKNGDELGEGSTTITVLMDDGEHDAVTVTVHTDEKTVGETLQKLGLLAGEEAEYGLYVKTVNGVTLDPDAGNAYWAFYINGEYAMTGVDMTDVEDGASYSLVMKTF